MRRTQLRWKRKPVEPRKPFAASTAPPVAVTGVRAVAGHTEAPKVISEPQEKRAVVKSRAVRDSARGEACTMQIEGVCGHDWSTTVLCHLPSEIRGTKATDLSAAYMCANCHDATDRRVMNNKFEQARDWYLRRAMVRTLTRMLEKGVITVRGAA